MLRGIWISHHDDAVRCFILTNDGGWAHVASCYGVRYDMAESGPLIMSRTVVTVLVRLV